MKKKGEKKRKKKFLKKQLDKFGVEVVRLSMKFAGIKKRNKKENKPTFVNDCLLAR